LKELRVNLTEKSYPLYISRGLIENIGEEIKKIYGNKKIAIITDENVDSFYGDKVQKKLESNDFVVKKLVLKPGEKSKSIEVLLQVYDELLGFGITRGDLIIALGGGVIGDLTGFAASTLLRGIPFVQIPTSLLAQIDSSIGGKVAVDLPRGKNLVGSFYHPEAVFIDPDMLVTLDKRFLYDGMAEVIKYGCIKDAELFNKLLSYKNEEELLFNMEDTIYKCCSIKKEIVERDEKDNGDRMLLNFGHTIGHAIEKYFNYEKYTHGEAVALGMYAITKRSEEMGITLEGSAELIKKILNKYNLKYEIKLEDSEEILNSIALDKKSKGEFLNIILIKEIGESFIHKIRKEEVKSFI